MLCLEIFILGLVFGLFIQPVLEGLANLVLTYLEAIKSELNVTIVKNERIMRGEEDVPKTNPIGFRLTGEEEDTDDL